MQRFPLKSERSNIASIRRNGGPDGSSTRKSPIDSPMTLNGMIKVLIIHHAPLVRSAVKLTMCQRGVKCFSNFNRTWSRLD